MLSDTSQMTYFIVILRYQPSKKLSRNSVKDLVTRGASKQPRCQPYESKRNSEKTQEKETYGSINI
jgi:hypothetical protein